MHSASLQRPAVWTAAEDARAFASAPFGHHSHPYQSVVAWLDQDPGVSGNKQIDPGPETDHPQPFPLPHFGADLVIGHDAARHKPRDLANQQLASSVHQPNRRLLVVEAGFFARR